MTSREVSEQTLLMIGIWLKTTERQHTLFQGYFIKLLFPRYFGFWTLSCHAVLWFLEYVLASRVSNSAILSNLQESPRYAEGAFFCWIGAATVTAHSVRSPWYYFSKQSFIQCEELMWLNTSESRIPSYCKPNQSTKTGHQDGFLVDRLLVYAATDC